LSSFHYKKCHEMLERNPGGVRIKQDAAQELGNVNELIDNGFLVVSDEYRRWADAENENGPHQADRREARRASLGSLASSRRAGSAASTARDHLRLLI